MNPRVLFTTLGCKLNQYETDAMATDFRSRGWEIVTAGDAEAFVVNGCTVTDRADRRSLGVISKLQKEFPRALVVVTGCIAEGWPSNVTLESSSVLLVPNGRKNQIPALVDSKLRDLMPALPKADLFGFSSPDAALHTRASLKIQDGCDHFCSFCIIPSVRGSATSRPKNDILAAARALIHAGRKEVVLTGVNLSGWRDGSLTLSDLIEELLGLDGDFRLRITSVEPEGLDKSFFELFRHPKMCPHLHLCLQSGSSRILRAMKRSYTVEQYQFLAEQLRLCRPDLHLSTDLIVGFPGEQATDFQDSLTMLDSIRFGSVHVFPFSRRRGTAADALPDQLPTSTKNQRSLQAQKAAHEIRRTILQGLKGQLRVVLVETPDHPSGRSRLVRGMTQDYYPVKFESDAPWNSFVRIEVGEVLEGRDGLILSARSL